MSKFAPKKRKNRKPGTGKPERNRSGSSSRAGKRRSGDGDTRLWLYGRHAVVAALANPQRKFRQLLATPNAAEWLTEAAADTPHAAKLKLVKPEIIDNVLPDGAVHQGVAAEVDDLPRARLKETCSPAEPRRPVLVLDQVTDPHNIGAIFRAAAAFNAKAIIVQERRTPSLSGALAKAAAGAIEITPCVKVVNIARAVEALGDLGYETLGLAGEADRVIANAPAAAPIALVLGAEGAGLRQLVRETCKDLVRIPISPQMESLNVSVAAAISLYEVSKEKE